MQFSVFAKTQSEFVKLLSRLCAMHDYILIVVHIDRLYVTTSGCKWGCSYQIATPTDRLTLHVKCQTYFFKKASSASTIISNRGLPYAKRHPSLQSQSECYCIHYMLKTHRNPQCTECSNLHLKSCDCTLTLQTGKCSQLNVCALH